VVEMSTFFYILLISQHHLTQKHQVIASTNVILQIFLNLHLNLLHPWASASEQTTHDKTCL